MSSVRGVEMSYPIDRKLVVAVSTTALFNLEAEDKIFKPKGIDAFKRYQNKNKLLQGQYIAPLLIYLIIVFYL
jgi:5'-nucleotidase